MVNIIIVTFELRECYLCYKEKVALSELKGHDSIIILHTDKSRSTVVMNKEQYIENMSNLIIDDKTYRPLNRDPTTSLENKIGKVIKDLKEQDKLNKYQAMQLTPRNSLSPKSYGLSKGRYTTQTHWKLHNSPSYNLATHLADILTPLSGKGMSYIKNSQQFAKRAKKISIETSEILVSFELFHFLSMFLLMTLAR
ncbi:hypothetical protein HOLleu_28842 [Holothuria leucospilota]|uniref:Uncharacterized protein n=1 Tax=Holothuria leucospilota TaxID=206669 RepID=A0A9Q1BN02_HOLLE|nr:hypothetical protein HOLleu_28842 [Holothuria leucospilota]